MKIGSFYGVTVGDITPRFAGVKGDELMADLASAVIKAFGSSPITCAEQLPIWGGSYKYQDEAKAYRYTLQPGNGEACRRAIIRRSNYAGTFQTEVDAVHIRQLVRDALMAIDARCLELLSRCAPSSRAYAARATSRASWVSDPY
jgi:hypothetical protein